MYFNFSSNHIENIKTIRTYVFNDTNPLSFFMLQKIKKLYNFSEEDIYVINTDKDYELNKNKFTYKPFFGDYHLLIINNENMKNKISELNKLILNNQYCVIFLVTDKKNFKFYSSKNSYHRKLFLFNNKYPSKLFNIFYIKNFLKKDITDKALNRILRYCVTSEQLHLSLTNINKLNSKLINDEIVKRNVNDYREYTIVRYVETTLLHNRKKVPYLALEDCINRYGAKETRKRICQEILRILAIKKHINDGIIITSDYRPLFKLDDERLKGIAYKNIHTYFEICDCISQKALTCIYNLYNAIEPTRGSLIMLTYMLMNRCDTIDLELVNKILLKEVKF